MNKVSEAFSIDEERWLHVLVQKEGKAFIKKFFAGGRSSVDVGL